MSSSTSEVAAPTTTTPFRWPLGAGMVPLLALTTVGAAGLLGSVADPMLQVGPWGYAAWLVAAAVTLLTVRSAAAFARDGVRSSVGSDTEGGVVERLPIETRTSLDPPMVERFRRRMGGWGTYVAGVAQFIGMVAASGVVAMVVSGTLLQADDGVVRAGAASYLVLLLLARAWLPEPHRLVSLVILVAVVLGLVGIGVHLELVTDVLADDAARPRPPITVEAMLQATAMLPIAFLPLMRMGVMVPGLPPARRRQVRRWVVPLTALVAAALGAFLGEAIEGVLDPASSTGTALAEAVSECPWWFGLAVQAVTLVLGTLTILVLLDDTQVIGGRMARLNSLTDVFAPPAGRRVSTPGELYVLGLATASIALTPTALDLLAFSAFCVLVLFGAIHVAVMRPRTDGRHQIAVAPLVALMVCVALMFALPPAVILAGVALISAAILIRALLIVWAQPLPPDVVEGLGSKGGSGSTGATGEGPSAAAAGRAANAPGDLPPDDPSRRTEGPRR